MSSPWRFKVAAHSRPAFHLLTSASAWLEIEGRPQPIRLSASDLVILRRGEGHFVRDSPKSPVTWLDRNVEDTPPVNGQLAYGGGGERSELLCGGFAVDQIIGRPLLEALPTVVHLRGSGSRAPEGLVGLIRMIATEMASSRAGSETVVARLTDALLAQALRECLIDEDRELRDATAVSDPKIARSLRLIRDHPDQRWSVWRTACLAQPHQLVVTPQAKAVATCLPPHDEDEGPGNPSSIRPQGGWTVLSLLSSDVGPISLQPNWPACRESASLHRLLDMLEVGGSIPSPPTKLDPQVAYSTCMSA